MMQDQTNQHETVNTIFLEEKTQPETQTVIPILGFFFFLHVDLKVWLFENWTFWRNNFKNRKLYYHFLACQSGQWDAVILKKHVHVDTLLLFTFCSFFCVLLFLDHKDTNTINHPTTDELSSLNVTYTNFSCV